MWVNQKGTPIKTKSLNLIDSNENRIIMIYNFCKKR